MPVQILPDRIDLESYEPSQSMVIDGFAYNAFMRWLPKRYRPDALSKTEWLRKSTGIFMPKMYTAPLDPTIPIGDFDTFSLQHRIVPGSYIWGWDFLLITTRGGVAQSNFWVQVVDHCTKRNIFSSFVNVNMIKGFQDYNRPFVLSNPFKIESQGLIDVQIKNNSFAGNVQFILHCAQPVDSNSDPRPSQQAQPAATLSGMRSLQGPPVRTSRRRR